MHLSGPFIAGQFTVRTEAYGAILSVRGDDYDAPKIAADIALALNCHEALVTELKRVRRWLENEPKAVGPGYLDIYQSVTDTLAKTNG